MAEFEAAAHEYRPEIIALMLLLLSQLILCSPSFQKSNF